MGHVVGLRIPELPKAHHRVGAEAERPSAGGQAVQAVREVHRVGRTGDEEDGPDRPQGGTHFQARLVEPGERELGVGRRMLQHQDRERGGHPEEPEHLGPLVKSQAALTDDLDPVIHEANSARPDDGQHHEDPAPRIDPPVEVAEDVAQKSPAHDGQAAHSGGPRLGGVALGAVVADGLAYPEPGQPPDQ